MNSNLLRCTCAEDPITSVDRAVLDSLLCC